MPEDSMEPQFFERRLAALLSADARGYSRLMDQDEEATVRTLSAYRKMMTSLVEQHRGRVVDSPGDNLLAEFASTVDAVKCALEIQKDLRARNAELPEPKRMEFRIGINLGDVIVEEDRVYGDGVNIAARLEGLAEGGGICISGTVYDQVKNKVRLPYESLGEHTVKNIAEPVRVYRVRTEAAAVSEASKDGNLPDEPSVAVLPFVNISGDPDQEYFADGITEDLITDLSKVSGLFVIARQSVFTYKNKPVKVGQIGRELGVRYVLEGSVRRAADRLRITAQLVDTKTEGHLWAERYDRDLGDIFALQDEVTQRIVASLSVKLTGLEEDRLAHRYTNNLEAYDFTLRGLEYYFRFTKEASGKAHEMFQKAIELDPGYALAYSRLGLAYLHEWTHGWSQDPRSLEFAFKMAQRAIALDESLPEAHRILGDVYLWNKDHPHAIDELEKAIALNPNYADAIAGLGEVLNWAGRPDEAIGLIKRAMRLNPHHHAWYLWALGISYASTNRNEEAIELMKRGLIRSPDFLGIHLQLAFLYAETGKKQEAQREVEEILRISPDATVEWLEQRIPSKDQAIRDRIAKGLRDAGLR